MSLWSRLFGSGAAAPIQNSSAAGGAIARWFLGQPVWTPRRYDRLADEAYVRNAIGYRCTKLIAEAASSVPLMLMKGDGEIENHKLLDLLAAPAPTVGGRQLFEAFYAYLLLAGNSYIEGVAPFDTRPPAELWVHRPDRMKVIAGASGLPQAYEYEVNGQTTRWRVDQVTGRGPIFHLKEFHPLNDWYGLSRVEPAAYGIDRHNEASKHNKALLQNGARPSGALIFKPVEINGQPQAAPPDIIKAAEERLDNEHVDLTRRGRPLVLGGNVSWEEMGLSPKDMDFGEGKADAARDTCSGFGVPHELIVPGNATYNNRAMARLELYEDTILPLVGRALDGLNGWLVPRFGDGMRLVADLDGVPALEPRRETKRKAAVDLFKGQILKRDEARAMLGYDSLGGVVGEALFTPTAPGANQGEDTGDKQTPGAPDKSEPDPAAAEAA